MPADVTTDREGTVLRAKVMPPLPAPPDPQPATVRMEAVGRLAAGAAHDFNNVLAAISAYAGLLAIELAADDPAQHHVAQIQKATERAVRLTRQLLAFGRREPQQTQLLDLNEVVEDVLPMLRQLIGDRIDLISNAAIPLPGVLADPGQVEQILVNLVLNARDAMPNGGRLVVSTGAVELDQGFVLAHPGSRPGSFVRLAVQDSGFGMDAEILAHIFEPYFTTKEPGRGTGLGLSTVYGIVKQSGGYVWAESASGRGTSVTVDLPAR